MPTRGALAEQRQPAAWAGARPERHRVEMPDRGLARHRRVERDLATDEVVAVAAGTVVPGDGAVDDALPPRRRAPVEEGTSDTEPHAVTARPSASGAQRP